MTACHAETLSREACGPRAHRQFRALTAACERVPSQPAKDLRLYLAGAWWGIVRVTKEVSVLARVLRMIAVGLVALFGTVAGLFIAGEALTDPGGWKAVVLTTAWAVPLIALSVLALVWPGPSSRVLPVVLALVAGWVIVDGLARVIDRDAWGPVGAVSMFAVLVPCGLLGVHRAAEAGWLMLAGAAAQFVATVASIDRAGGQSLWSALGGSTGVMVLPFLVLATVFLAVAAAERWTGHTHGGTQRLGHAH